ncbi:MAG: hypothetical protein ACI9K4_001078, partial [Polaribacter sp.]
ACRKSGSILCGSLFFFEVNSELFRMNTKTMNS